MELLNKLRHVLRRQGPGEATTVAAWAASRGFDVEAPDPQHVSIGDATSGWQILTRKSTRHYIDGFEVTGTCHLGVDVTPSIVLVDRRLQERLERQAYATATHQLHTGLHDAVPPEVLWLASCEQVGWNGPADEFWARWSVLASKRGHARAWIDDGLQEAVVGWAADAGAAPRPFILALNAGKIELRAAHTSVDALLQLTSLFSQACATAKELFAEDLAWPPSEWSASSHAHGSDT